jgi:50S ribosomal subunit-associated GTPase HflX
MLVFNKLDAIAPEEAHHVAMRHGGLTLSAHDAAGVRELRAHIEEALEKLLPTDQPDDEPSAVHDLSVYPEGTASAVGPAR